MTKAEEVEIRKASGILVLDCHIPYPYTLGEYHHVRSAFNNWWGNYYYCIYRIKHENPFSHRDHNYFCNNFQDPKKNIYCILK